MRILLLVMLFASSVFGQELTLKEQKILEEQQKVTLLNLPEENESAIKSQTPTVPIALDVDSEEIIKKRERVLPNDGNPYFTLSGSIAPYQVSIGFLKYFIPEWWGQFDLDLAFMPNVPVDNYYLAMEDYQPYASFRIVTGYAFYNYNIFEISLMAQVQFVFVGTEDIPILPSLGMRFVFDFFYIDVGVSYAVGVGSYDNLLFSGWHPAVTLGFRF